MEVATNEAKALVGHLHGGHRNARNLRTRGHR